MMIGDPIVIKILERVLRRKLTKDEKSGERVVIAGSHKVKIPQVNIQYIHNKNSCK